MSFYPLPTRCVVTYMDRGDRARNVLLRSSKNTFVQIEKFIRDTLYWINTIRMNAFSGGSFFYNGISMKLNCISIDHRANNMKLSKKLSSLKYLNCFNSFPRPNPGCSYFSLVRSVNISLTAGQERFMGHHVY